MSEQSWTVSARAEYLPLRHDAHIINVGVETPRYRNVAYCGRSTFNRGPCLYRAEQQPIRLFNFAQTNQGPQPYHLGMGDVGAQRV